MIQDQPDKVRMTSTLLQAGRQWRRLAEQVLTGEGVSDARAAALIWVHWLGGGGVRQVALATRIGIEGTSLVRLLDQLCAAELLERRDDPDDRRAKTVWLTERGRALATRMEAALDVLRGEVFRDIDAADVRATLRVFAAIERASAEALSATLRMDAVA